MKRVLILLTTLLIAFQASAQVLSDPQEAFNIAAKSNKNVLLVFSGSDWCIPCMQFEKRILSDKKFEDFAAQMLVMLKADFPQKKKIAAILKSQYEDLADSFNPNGNFPYIVLLSPDKKLLGNLTYESQTTADFISELEEIIK
ncbi:MAG: thioredoxin family protein [Bacteroidetes bacterium]|nr:thioredoxin family protein [Bacteroidota bacterium]